MNTCQYSLAEDFVDDLDLPTETRVSICGHSLGGAIAQVVGNRQRIPFVTFNAPGVALVSRNWSEVAVSGLVGMAYVRAAGTMASAVRHPLQAVQDLASLFHLARGLNFRLGWDVVGSVGVHYGRVIQIPYSGKALDVLAKHKMATVIEALRASQYHNLELDVLLAGR